MHLNGVPVDDATPADAVSKPDSYIGIVHQIFATNHPNGSKVTQWQLYHHFCLREGRNTIHIEYHPLEIPKAHSLYIYMKSLAYTVPVFEFRQQETNSGTIDADFDVFPTMPVGYQTLILNSQ